MKRCAEVSASAEITAVQKFWQPPAMNFYHFRMARRLPLLRADEAKHYVAISYISIKNSSNAIYTVDLHLNHQL